MRGCFFLSGSRASHAGPERVADLLNAETGFFPVRAALGQRRHDRAVQPGAGGLSHAAEETIEAQLDPGYSVATERAVRMLLSNGDTVEGRVRVLSSERARSAERLRAGAGNVPVHRDGGRHGHRQQRDHIVELRETTEA